MKACEAKEGVRYISRTGIPVTVTGTKNGKVLIRLETTKTTVAVNGDYELKPIVVKPMAKESKLLPKSKSEVKAAPKGHTEAPVSMAALIDPMLLAGGHTVKDIATEVLKKAGDLAKGKDLEANVRARMVAYTRKGWQVSKDGQKRVKVLQKKG